MNYSDPASALGLQRGVYDIRGCREVCEKERAKTSA